MTAAANTRDINRRTRRMACRSLLARAEITNREGLDKLDQRPRFIVEPERR
jgi:hypothetical protein